LPGASGHTAGIGPAGGGSQSYGWDCRAIRGYRRFVAKSGSKWLVRWNRLTGAAEFGTGRPFGAAGVDKVTAANVEHCCRAFVADNPELFGAASGQLDPATKTRLGQRWFVDFRQVHEAVPVLGGHLRMALAADEGLMMFGSNIYPDVAVKTEPVIDANEAMKSAVQDCFAVEGIDTTGRPELCILPLYRPEGFEYLLCWQLYISQDEAHKKWRYLIDGETGRIVSKVNTLIYQNITGTAQVEYKAEFGSDPVELGPFVHGDVTASEPEVVIASWDFETNPGWATEGGWAFGPAVGGGPAHCGYPDSGYTGTNVYGYNPAGNYPNDMSAEYLTTSSIDCSAYSNVQLVFMRWLGVESSYWDHADIEVSDDGVNWSQVWGNPTSSICDGRWFRVSYDISDVAALQDSVYIRWVMGPTDGSVTYGGWYIDDVMLVSCPGERLEPGRTDTEGFYTVASAADSSVVSSRLQGAYCDVDYACGPDAFFRQDGVQQGQTLDFCWDSNWYTEFVESNVYWHLNLVHDYYAAMDPNLSVGSASYPNGLDYSMRAVVQAGCADSYCNAYWDGRKLVFGRGMEGYCDDFGLYADVIYHEYTHAVTSKIYDGVPLLYMGESGALNEAWSDYFGCILSPSESPLVGDGGLIERYPDGFRSLDNTYRTERDFGNEVHFDSQMVSGALWEARRLLKNKIGAGEWDRLVHFARYGHAKTFEQYLLSLLAEDDACYGDSDPTNGTPHGSEIHEAFGAHGIGGLQYVIPSIVIDDSAGNGNGNGKLEPGETVRLWLSLSNGWADAVNVSGRLVTGDHFVKIEKSGASFDNVVYGDTTDNAADAFVVALDSECPRTHSINFELGINAEGPYRYSRRSLLSYPVAVEQLVYDDGQVDDLYVGNGVSGAGLAVRATPEAYPCHVAQVRLFPYPDTNSVVAVTIWDDDGPQGLPGTILGCVEARITGGKDWFDVSFASLGLVIEGGSFYVGWVTLEDNFYNGVDMDPPYYGRSWAYFYYGFGGQWISFDNLSFIGGNLMVRVRYVTEFGEGPVENADTGKRYPSIQEAIDDAGSGEEIIVSEGLYHENIDFLDKNLVLRSVDPNSPEVVKATIISGNGRGASVTFASGQDQSCMLCGFTITGSGRGLDRVGAVSCIKVGQKGPTIRNCIITGNEGPGVYVLDSSPIISNCLITSNEGDGIESRANSYPQMHGCIIADNGGNGVYGGYARIENCTIAGNAGAGVFNARASITNSIIYNNAVSAIKGQAQATYSDIEGFWPGLGNIDAEPCFAEAGTGDYHLKSRGWRWDAQTNQWTWDEVTSRCIDAGNPGTALCDEPLVLEVDPLNRWGLNLRVNMGGYGGTAEASMAPPAWALQGDLTNDGVLDFVDAGLWRQYWLSAGPGQPGDLNRDSIVNMSDFAFLALQWLQQTSWQQ